jgi:CRP/FNR family transcriptional regulator, cyclic AMP receptor protein
MTPASVRHEALRRLELLPLLSPEELAAFDAATGERWLEPGDVLFYEGEHDGTLGIVAHGVLTVSLRGGELEVASLGPGSLVGAGAFFDGPPRSASVVASAPSVLVELDPQGFATLRREQPRAASLLLGAVLRDTASKLRGVDRRVAVELGEVGGFAPLSTPPSRAESVPAARRSTVPPAGASLAPGERRGLAETLRCAEGDLDALLAASDRRMFCAGEVISSQGTEATSCFIILAGEVEVVRELIAAERVLTTLGAGAIAGQLALVDGTRRSSTLRAKTVVAALQLRRDGFARLLRAISPVALALQAHLAVVGVRQLREADRRLSAVLARGGDASRPASASDPTRNERDRRDLEYLRAAVEEIAMSLDPLEVDERDLTDAPEPPRPPSGPPPLPHARGDV